MYAPLTQSAVQMMICVETCTDGEVCESVMELDFGMVCSSGDVQRAMVTAIAVLVVMCVLIPAMLLYWAYAGVQERRVSLSLKISDIDHWFREIDVDKSGWSRLAFGPRASVA